MTEFTHADKLHRLVKHALDSGAAHSLAEAKALFASYRLHLHLDEADANDQNNQDALLTAVALSRRVFLGGVTVSVPSNIALKSRLSQASDLADAVRELGASVEDSEEHDTPTISIGKRANRSGDFHVRTVFRGWRGGIVPANVDETVGVAGAMPLTPMLAAALAVNEAYHFVSGATALAGKRSVGLSLWNLESDDWLAHSASEPALRLLPRKLWLIGLGHLGQAYLWALALLPYKSAGELNLVLQDFDIVTPSTESTSVLSDHHALGSKKTRIAADWAEKRGFDTNILERRFDTSMKRQQDEPTIALCGLDNALGRQPLDQVGFDFVVEAGLGRGHQDFCSIALHTLPGSRKATEIWKTTVPQVEVTAAPAYEKLLEEGVVDRCGMALLAGRAVGAPFVGAVAACLVIAEVLRLLEGAHVHELVDLNLKAIEHRVALENAVDFSTLNPGYVDIGNATSAKL